MNVIINRGLEILVIKYEVYLWYFLLNELD